MIEKEFIENKAEEMLLNAGMVTHVSGFYLLKEAIAIAYQNPRMVTTHNTTFEFYEILAQNHDSSAWRVERALRNCIELSYNRGVFKKIPQFCAQWGSVKPTNTATIKLFTLILKNNLEQQSFLQRSDSSSPSILSKAAFASDDIAIKRAFFIKMLVRLDKNGEICTPWSEEALDLKSNSKLYYAAPMSITKQLGENFEFCATASKEQANLKYYTTIITHHEPDARFYDSFSATIAGVLKQIPFELVAKTRGFELVDYGLGNNQIAFSPEYGKEMRFVGTRLYTTEIDKEIPTAIVEQPIIYGESRITEKNVDNFLNSMAEKAG